jgi:hypothetical protein
VTIPALTNTAYRAIDLAMHDAGLLAEGTEPNSDQLARNLGRLNDMINLWQTQGCKLFLLEDVSQALTAGLALYSFGAAGTTVMAKPHRVVDAYLVDSSGSRIPLRALSWEEYVKVNNSTTQGTPNGYFVDKQYLLLKVSLWPTPASGDATTYTLHVILRKQITNFVSLTDDMVFPQEWFIALRWGLADELASGQAQAIMDRCEKRAVAYRTALEDWDVEDASVYFQAEVRHG